MVGFRSTRRPVFLIPRLNAFLTHKDFLAHSHCVVNKEDEIASLVTPGTDLIFLVLVHLFPTFRINVHRLPYWWSDLNPFLVGHVVRIDRTRGRVQLEVYHLFVRHDEPARLRSDPECQQHEQANQDYYQIFDKSLFQCIHRNSLILFGRGDGI